MVIVSATTKTLQKKKVAVTSTVGSNGKQNVVKGSSAVNNAKPQFVRPTPRPISIGPTTVGGGRGKVKTTRNNTLPLPSPKSGLLNQNGPRIHAQRKFAQGATTFSSSGVTTLHTHRSPAVTPTKDSSKLKKKILTPISPPLKRPKTEDFLTFLCFRGTPALPPGLDYFNYSHPLEVDDVPAKKTKESVSVSTSVGTDSCQSFLSSSASTASSTGSCQLKAPLGNIKSSNGSGKQHSKLITGKKIGLPSVEGILKKKQINGVHAPERSPEGTKNEPNGEIIKQSEKVAKKTATPLISPSASRINEQDAKFAMTALKLKYVEKRLANARPAKSLITMLTKKVKERSMVLTRSRAKTAVGPLKTSPIQRKLKKPIIRPPEVNKPVSRNAPSPDIILGVTASPVKPIEPRRCSSSSGTDESDSEESEGKKTSSSSDGSSSESEDADAKEPTKRSLRSGKELGTEKKKDRKSTPTRKKSSPERRIGTRATHRHTKSPLRELPMWNVAAKKKKILAKYKKNAKVKANQNARNAILKTKSGQVLQSPTGHITRSAVRKSAGVSKGGRPSRKTKESAATKIGLINKDFSSDDEHSSDESDKEEKSSAAEDSSSAEEKFLENQYNASIKRTKTSAKDADRNSSSSSSRLRSQQKSSSSSEKDSQKSASKTEKSSKLKGKVDETKKQKEDKAMPRVLRSRSSGSMDSSSKSETSSATERRKLLMMTCGKDTAGAARKSAKIISRGRSASGPYSSSDEDDEDDDESRESESDIDDGKETNSELSTDGEEEDEKPALKRCGTDSPLSIPSSRGSRAKSKRVTELIEESRKRERRSPSLRSSLNSSPVDNKSVKSEGSRSSSTELRKIKQEETTKDDTDDEEDEEGAMEDDEEEDDVIGSPVASIQESDRDEDELEEMDTGGDETNPSSIEASKGLETTLPQSNSSSSSEEESIEEEEEEEEDDDDEDDYVEDEIPVEKTDIAIQVDMDLEEAEEEKKRLAEEKAKKEEALKAEAAKAKISKTSEAGTSTELPKARTSSIQLPLSEEQKAELQQAQEEDDEIQEIGQVIKNPQAIKHCHHHHQRRRSPSPPIIQPIGPTITQQTIPPPPPPQPRPETIPLSSIPSHIPPLATRTSSLTYTSHHINLGGSSVPFVPYASRPSATDFFPHPPLFGPTHLVNSVHLVGSSTTDYTGDLTSPLSTLSIPVSVPTLSSFPNPLLPPPPPIGLVPGAATMTATSLQTHIRTVATNLDIPLVRPVVGSTDTSLSFAMGMAQPPPLGSIPLLGAHSSASLLSRPLGAWHQASASHAAAAAAAAEATRNHYSAFRLPTMQPPPPHSASNHVTMMGVSKEGVRPSTSSSTLPVSIVHPRAMPQQQTLGRAPAHSQHTSTHAAHNNVREIHHQHSSSTASTASAYMQNYNPESIIRNLPNVSIVPKFDRSSAKSHIPSNHTSSSSGSSSSKKSHKERDKQDEHKKTSGKKKKEPTTLPTPSSPLTVRKDSNPATYCGSSSKIKKKLDEHETKKFSSSSSPKKHDDNNTNASTSKFDAVKLLHMKQERVEDNETPPPLLHPRPSSSSSFPSPNSNKIRRSPTLIRPESIKQEIISSPCSSSRKSQSPSVAQRKTPDRPSSSSSANHSSDTSSKKSSGGTSSKKSNSSSILTNPKLLEAPTYHPTEQEFEDPLKYFEKIQSEAEKYGMARIVPPRSFRPECNVNDDMRFTAYNHYIHKMYNRWGPTVQETEAIKEHLKRSEQDVSSIPVIGGMEIDFSTLYQAVQSFGGLKEVIEKEKWADVADRLHIPKGTHDRTTKLDGVYVKYILPYDALSDEERKNLHKQVQEKWTERTKKLQERTDESSEDETSDEDSMDELDDCVIKGKGTPLSAYYRVARNTVGMIFSNGKEPLINEVEEEYWKIVREGKKHLCVYSGSIDCTGQGWGFPAPKASSKHPWNLKVLANNPGSVLRSMGPVMGATVPTLHVSMLFTSYCWYRDPHGLSWVEYLHSGASKIWYSVAGIHEKVFRKALMKLMPLQCKNKKIWLPSDSAMVPPELLLENDVPLVRAVQNPGEFLVVFPKSFTSAICGGYLVSESVCFAPPVWLKTCMEMFKDIRDSKEPPVFPVEKLLLSIIRDNKASSVVIKMAAPLAERVIVEELALRKKLISLGVSQGGKPKKDSSGKEKSKKKRAPTEDEAEQCYFCNYILQMSLVRNERTDFVTCLPHAIQHLSRHKAQIKKCTLLCEETQEELESLLQTAKRRANS